MNKFMLIAKYAELSGYSQEAIRQKIKKGVWQYGKHVRKAPDSRIMINVEEVEAWITSSHAA